MVHITTLSLLRNRWNLNVERVPEGTGSGIVWDKDGHIVTNFHVVQGVVQNGGRRPGHARRPVQLEGNDCRLLPR